jgi:hypothetical protein
MTLGHLFVKEKHVCFDIHMNIKLIITTHCSLKTNEKNHTAAAIILFLYSPSSHLVLPLFSCSFVILDKVKVKL